MLCLIEVFSGTKQLLLSAAAGTRERTLYRVASKDPSHA